VEPTTTSPLAQFAAEQVLGRLDRSHSVPSGEGGGQEGAFARGKDGWASGKQ